jgi:predicted RND superfamily exporter protein
VAAAAGGGGPVIGAACLATIAGFAVFALSPSPLVRSFGLLLVMGVALAFAVALTGGLAALGLSAWRGSTPAAASAPADRHASGATARLQKTGVAGPSRMPESDLRQPVGMRYWPSGM